MKKQLYSLGVFLVKTFGEDDSMKFEEVDLDDLGTVKTFLTENMSEGYLSDDEQKGIQQIVSTLDKQRNKIQRLEQKVERLENEENQSLAEVLNEYVQKVVG